LVFKTLKEYAGETSQVDPSSDESINSARDEANKIIDICERHGAIWAALWKLLPSFRSVTKLTWAKKDIFLQDIDLYWDVYIINCGGSINPKLHLLKDHVKRLLGIFDTIGLFSEDAMESIHAVVNALARWYAALDAERMVMQFTRSL
jgi:hypothetical protein